MNATFTKTGFLSAITLVGATAFAQAGDGMSSDAPMSCCAGGQMMTMAADDESVAKAVELTESEQKAVDKLTMAYLSIQKSLASDSADGVAAEFKAVHEAAHALATTDDADLKAAANKVATAAHDEPEALDAAREAVKPLSEALTDLARIAPPSDDATANLYVAYCPMAKASWLQTSKEIANPYMGQDMLKCGNIRSTLKGDAQ